MNNRKIDDFWEVSQEKLPITLEGAVLFLNKWFSQQTNDEDGKERPLIEVISEKITENPKKWWVEHHFGWGMSIRNLLRENGFTEKQLGIDNLDDYYINLIEQACLKDKQTDK